MDTKLKVISYNCQSFNANGAIIQDLLSMCDILCLQETLIDDSNFQNIDCFNNSFSSAYVPAYRKHDNFVGRPSGGLIIFWKVAENLTFIPKFFDNRIMGLKIIFSDNRSFLLLNVYMPCDYGNVESALMYKESLAKLDNICESEDFDDICIIGDFNADPTKGRFFRDFSKFCEDNSFLTVDIDFLPSESYTYVSSNDACSSSWLDHICCSNLDMVRNPLIMYGQTVYDHIPISFDLGVPIAVRWVEERLFLPVVSNIKWDALTAADKQIYSYTLDELCLEINYDALNCIDPNCISECHRIDLAKLYVELMDCMDIAAADSLPNCKAGHGGSPVIGWNNYCKELYKTARTKFLLWHAGGKIRMGQIFDEMKSSRRAFKNALNYCRKNENKIKRENILGKFSQANKSKFWKEISKINKMGGNKTRVIDGKSKPEEITAIFDHKYRGVLNDSACQTGSAMYDNYVPDVSTIITLDNLKNAIFELNEGIGWDGIHANNFKFAGPVFINIFAKFLNKLLSHSFVPKIMLQGQIRPIIKNNAMSKSDSSNYRPVMNSGMGLKIFEYTIMPFLTKALKLSNCQFGFRQDTSCISAITVVKETIFRYNSENSNVHAALIDCSKAFDKINKNILFNLLENSGLDRMIVRVIRCMYCNTYVNTCFNGCDSEPWKTENGTRQGGIISPILFSYYINQVIEEISNMKVGCSLFGYKTGIICYADDILLLSPSINGLQSMLNVLSTRLRSLCLTVNPLKSNFIIFKRARYTGGAGLSVFLDNIALEQVNHCKYLGVILSGNGDLGLDVDRVTVSFLKQFYSMYGKFKFCEKNVLYHLFRTFTSSFYGIEVWAEKLKGAQLHKISVAYHKAIKIICGLNQWDSNHVACDQAGLPIFRHLLAKRVISVWHRVCYSKSPCLANLKYYFRHKGLFTAKIEGWIFDNYACNIRDNPFCAMVARINYVQRTEPRSNYVY